MKTKILIVEDQFVEANNLQLILERAGYVVTGIARAVSAALKAIERTRPDLVMLDIHLQGTLTGIDLAGELAEMNIGFVYLSANSNKTILDAAKQTRPYGFLVKPFRAKDVLVMLDVAWYLHQHNEKFLSGKYTAVHLNDEGQAELGNIISRCAIMDEVLKNIKIVSSTETSVLILGESGTGKELAAKAIHKLSKRAKKPFVVVNCGALPANLIESELFGHEKGAFTGAMNSRVGKFELADGGTIFLDEIGELPLDLQVKFLRVLQEREIERIGGQTRKVDVRIIAATNRDLEEEVASDRFRLDLFYRLNVFPILLPTLRERKNDIPLLAEYFLKRYSDMNGKIVTGFSEDVLNKILAYDWPGNVRQLENLMERSVLLAEGPLITTISLPKNKNLEAEHFDEQRIRTIEENERDHIISVLKMCNWRVSGNDGAAEILKVNVNTLNSKIKKLGIKKQL
ncbi:sigma-54 dependent transcriptional regulator [Pedobacter sp. Leaf194]|uniref:sigma-54-dependent transcriptional regulator n=1 Tax=Pedobacter sp. Leaf194 TaxID=1736297 RepID=UPI000702606E|nr:sigma-54 dependent transcriptional regulator [Pedobacter sp. Leaf194]KQS36200.1 Fis family transcriptional regulator [Pedobacter sp. Leaf194]